MTIDNQQPSGEELKRLNIVRMGDGEYVEPLWWIDKPERLYDIHDYFCSYTCKCRKWPWGGVSTTEEYRDVQ